MIPSVISGWPNSAVSEATIMSHSSASSQPPPSAKPDTAAISGVRQAAMRCQKAIVDASITSWKVRSAIALMSAPAANTSSLPAITMQRTPASASKSSTAAASSSSTAGESALRFSGRSSGTIATASSRSKRDRLGASPPTRGSAR